MGQRLEKCEQSHLFYMPTLVAECMHLDLQILATLVMKTITEES